MWHYIIFQLKKPNTMIIEGGIGHVQAEVAHQGKESKDDEQAVLEKTKRQIEFYKNALRKGFDIVFQILKIDADGFKNQVFDELDIQHQKCISECLSKSEEKQNNKAELPKEFIFHEDNKNLNKQQRHARNRFRLSFSAPKLPGEAELVCDRKVTQIAAFTN